jgi:hypothetical protein
VHPRAAHPRAALALAAGILADSTAHAITAVVGPDRGRKRTCPPGRIDLDPEMSLTLLDLPTVRSGSHWVRSSLVAGQVAYLAGTRPHPAFLKGPRDSRAIISLNGEHTGLLNSACSRP